MILLSYILLGHPDWEGAEIHIYAAFPIDEVEEQTAKLDQMILEGRLPIASKNLQIIPTDDRVDFAALVEKAILFGGSGDPRVHGGPAQREGLGSSPQAPDSPGCPLCFGGGDHFHRVMAHSARQSSGWQNSPVDPSSGHRYP